MPAAPIPPQNHSTGLSAPFQFNSKTKLISTTHATRIFSILMGQQKRDISYHRLLLHNDRISLPKRDSPSMICNPRGLFTYKEKIR